LDSKLGHVNARRGNIVKLAENLDDFLTRDWDELRDPSQSMYGNCEKRKA